MSRYDLSFISLLQHVALARARTLRQPTESICALNQQGSELDNVLFSLSLSFLLCRMRMESPSLPTVLWQHKWQVAPAYHEVQLTGYWRKKKKKNNLCPPSTPKAGTPSFPLVYVVSAVSACVCVVCLSALLWGGASSQTWAKGRRDRSSLHSPSVHISLGGE